MSPDPRANVTLRMPKVLRDRLAKIAAERGMSLNEWMLHVLAAVAEHNEVTYNPAWTKGEL